MEQHVKVPMSQSSNAGFTLLEVLVAIVITMIGLLGLLEAATLATEQNLKNQMRDEAVMIAEDVVRSTQIKTFTAVSSVSKTYPSRLRGVSKNYNAVTTVLDAGNSKKFTVNVSWTYKSETTSHEVTSMVSQ